MYWKLEENYKIRRAGNRVQIDKLLEKQMCEDQIVPTQAMKV